MTALETALSYLVSGWSLVPVLADGSKKPSCAWKKFQQTPPSEAQVRAWYKNKSLGTALIHGAVSGRTEVLDFDSYEAGEAFCGLVREHEGAELLDRFPRVITPSGGRHVYWRVADGVDLAGNLKLASAADRKTLIETRGEGGYTLAPGSPSACHPLQRSYQLQPPGDLCNVATITGSERAFLIGLARSLNRFVEPERMARPPAPKSTVPRVATNLQPGEDYNNRSTYESVLELLLRHGWTQRLCRDGGCELLRPGKKGRGSSATLGIVADTVFYVFSSNASPFDQNHGYDPFAVYTHLEAGGDYHQAAIQLGGQGFGAPLAERVQMDTSDLLAPPPKAVMLPPSLDSEEDSEEETDNLKCTDAGNAERLIALFGRDLRHVPGLGWRIWDGRRWSADETALTRMARETMRGLYKLAGKQIGVADKLQNEADRKEQADRAKKLLSWATRCESTAALAAMVSQASSFRGIKADLEQFLPRAWLVPFQNGVWDRGEWREHRREDWVETLLPVAYNPCVDQSEWLQLLTRMTGGDAALARTMQEVAGYVMSGASSLRILPWLYGPRGTGKSTFAELMLTILGGAGKMLDWSLISGQREAERLGAAVRGLRGIVLPEAGKKHLSAEILKSLSGSDSIPCRHLYKDTTYSISPSWVLLAVSNDPPAMNAHDDALKDRIMAVPFTHPLDDGPDLVFSGGTRLEEVRRHRDSPLVAGFLAWVMEGLERVFRTQQVYRAPVVIQHTRLFWSDTDPLTPFWEGLEEGLLEKGMATSALHGAYVAWCEKQGIRKPLQGRAWAAACRSQGLESRKTRVEMIWFRQIGGGVEESSEEKLRKEFEKRKPQVKMIRHYGGGSGLLFNEIEEAIAQ